MRFVSRTMVCMAAMTAMGLHAQSTNTFDLQYNFIVRAPVQPTVEATTFWERFSDSFSPTASEVFDDQFYPMNTLGENAAWANGTASHALQQSVLYTAREAAVDLPIMVWLEQHQPFLGHLLGDSVDDVGEESLAPLDPTYRPAEEQWWGDMAQRGNMAYGLRPFGTSPYAFLTMAVHNAGHVALLIHVRYHYDLLADHHVECAISAPLAHGFSLDMGTSYQFGQHDDQKKLVVKMIREIGHGGVVSFGVDMETHPTLVAGINFAM